MGIRRVCKIIKFGDSLSVVVPSRVVKKLKAKKGDYLMVEFMELEK